MFLKMKKKRKKKDSVLSKSINVSNFDVMTEEKLLL